MSLSLASLSLVDGLWFSVELKGRSHRKSMNDSKSVKLCQFGPILPLHAAVRRR